MREQHGHSRGPPLMHAMLLANTLNLSWASSRLRFSFCIYKYQGEEGLQQGSVLLHPGSHGLLCAQHRARTQASDRPSAVCEPGYVRETQKVEGDFQYFPLQEESITATFGFPTSTEQFWKLWHPQSLHPAQDLSSPGIFHAAAPITNSPGGAKPSQEPPAPGLPPALSAPISRLQPGRGWRLWRKWERGCSREIICRVHRSLSQR